ncbi:replication protein [Chloroflexota bacterium]
MQWDYMKLRQTKKSVQLATKPRNILASPKLENGFTKIPNEILEPLARTKLSPYESRVLLLVLRKTYGWHKELDWISLSQISMGTGIAKPNVCRTIKRLKERNIITRPDSKHIGFQKDCTKWH